MKPLFIPRGFPAVVCLIASLAFPPAAGAQTTYRWVDKDGKVFYSDQPPPKEIKKAEQRRLGISSIDTSGMPYEARKAAQDHPVTLYTSTDCKAECQGAREFLARRGIPFREASVSGPDEAAAFRKAFGTDKLAVPSVTIGGQKQQGFEEGAWGGMLNNAGYPNSASNGASAPAPAAK
ncbi:MAG: glutaredoxin family protein [Rhodocyclaceae bacterium]|jgi:glutaredoxin|nr:glutaredoxin family protein [Rhodocyclaceae bacterium]